MFLVSNFIGSLTIDDMTSLEFLDFLFGRIKLRSTSLEFESLSIFYKVD